MASRAMSTPRRKPAALGAAGASESHGHQYGCGVAACGACTVHVDGVAVRSCSLPVSAAIGKRIVTIEGLTAAGSHPLVQAWIAEQARNAAIASPVRS